MKKKLLSFLLIFSSFLFIGDVQAIELDKDDITKGSYIIGTHLFERKETEHYSGTLTVQHIMLAAQTIDSDKIEDMVIYLKNSRGNWVNGLTNEPVTMPEKIKIEYQNVEKISEILLYGDVNNDGKIDDTDTSDLLSHIKGEIEFNEKQKQNADVNIDGYINSIDYNLILGFQENYFPNTLPNKPIIDYILYGDVSNDGIINNEDTELLLGFINNENILSEQGFKNSDVNADGKTNESDYEILSRALQIGLFEKVNSLVKPVYKYTITFDSNGGSDVENISVVMTDKISEPNRPTKEGYMFQGWYLNDEFYYFGSAITGDITLVAKWEPYKYNVAYINTCDKGWDFADPSLTNFVGSGYMNQQNLLEYDKLYFVETNQYKCSITLSFVTETAKTIEDRVFYADFKGWSKEKLDGEVMYRHGDKIINLSNTNRTVYLYTVWETSDIFIYLPNPGTKEGYVFKGWYSDSKFENFIGYEESTISDINSTTLYAKWEPITYEVAYDKNDTAATGVMENTSCTYDKDCELRTNGFEKLGYTLKGWSTSKDGEVEYSYNDNLKVKNLTSTNEIITLYAIWEPTIGDANGDGLINQKDYQRIRKHLSGTEILNGDRLIAADVNQDGVVDYVDFQVFGRYMLDEIEKLPYKTGTKYTITYDLNGGVVDDYNPTEYSSNIQSITLKNPTKEGYKFLGWTGSNGQKAQTSLIIPKETTGNLTYTANWILIEDIPETPTIATGTSIWINTGVLGGVIELCESGIYDYQNRPYGAELYEKNGNNYTLIDSVTDACMMSFELQPGETKVYSVRTYINYNDETKVYSNYSNELLLKNENIITYDLNGGVNSPNNKFGYSSSKLYDLEAPTKLGYTFSGWTGSNGETPQVEVTIEKGTTGQLHYVANWELIDESAIDDTIPLTPTIAPGHDLWTITGKWTGDLSFCETGTYTHQNRPDGAELYEKTSSGYILVDNVTDDCYLYFELNPGESKVYTARVYTLDENNNKVYSNYSNELLLKNENVITYDLNGGINSINNIGGYSDSRPIANTLEAPTKEGYTFLGWTGSNGETPELEVTIEKGTTGHLHYIANWKVEE